MPLPAGTPCRPHEEPSAQRAGRVKGAAALRAVARTAPFAAARPMGDLAAERTQLLTRSGTPLGRQPPALHMTFLQRLCAGAGAGVGAGGPPERDNSCAFKSFATLSEAVLPLRDAPFRAAWAPDGSGRCRLRQEPEPSLFSGAAMLGRAVMGAIAAAACGQPAKANTRAAPIAMLFRARFIGHSVRSLVSANVRFHISGGYQSKRIVQMGAG